MGRLPPLSELRWPPYSLLPTARRPEVLDFQPLPPEFPRLPPEGPLGLGLLLLHPLDRSMVPTPTPQRYLAARRRCRASS